MGRESGGPEPEKYEEKEAQKEAEITKYLVENHPNFDSYEEANEMAEKLSKEQLKEFKKYDSISAMIEQLAETDLLNWNDKLREPNDTDMMKADRSDPMYDKSLKKIIGEGLYPTQEKAHSQRGVSVMTTYDDGRVIDFIRDQISRMDMTETALEQLKEGDSVEEALNEIRREHEDASTIEIKGIKDFLDRLMDEGEGEDWNKEEIDLLAQKIKSIYNEAAEATERERIKEMIDEITALKEDLESIPRHSELVDDSYSVPYYNQVDEEGEFITDEHGKNRKIRIGGYNRDDNKLEIYELIEHSGPNKDERRYVIDLEEGFVEIEDHFDEEMEIDGEQYPKIETQKWGQTEEGFWLSGFASKDESLRNLNGPVAARDNMVHLVETLRNLINEAE